MNYLLRALVTTGAFFCLFFRGRKNILGGL